MSLGTRSADCLHSRMRSRAGTARRAWCWSKRTLWDSTRSRLVGLTAALSGASVYSINVTTGAATALATGLAGIDNNGWTYDPVIDRLWAFDYGGNIYQYNPTTFARTTIATGAGNHTCVAFVP